MKFLINIEELELLFNISRTVIYNSCQSEQLSQPTKWMGDKRVMFGLTDVANQLADLNNLTPATEDVLRQYREAVMFVRMEKLARRKICRKKQ